MMPQQAMTNDPLSPHTPSPLPADADATVTGTDMVYLRRAQFDISACPEDEYPPVNQARCSNKLLEHLEHLHETNDLFGNLAKSQSAEGIDPVMASFELVLCGMAEQDRIARGSAEIC
jgi:hypothetical protein